jgi:hypothetical protein
MVAEREVVERGQMLRTGSGRMAQMSETLC